MGIEEVKAHLKKFKKDADVIEIQGSTATVELAAAALGVEAAKIAKTLTFRNGDSAMLITVAGDAKIDNTKFKNTFGFKARMLSPDEVLEWTGHAVGGICPFGIAKPIDVWIDDSLKRFDYVYPGCGSSNSMIKLTPEEVESYALAKGWVDVCKL